MYEYERALRLWAFAGIFLAVAAVEVIRPRRKPTASKAVRWINNLGLVTFNTVLVQVLLGAIGTATAALAQERGWGLFHNVEVSPGLAMVLCIVTMDFILYLQHVMFHAVPALWRLHRVHHADVDCDVTLGARFHPVEILISVGIKLTVIVLLGPTPATVVLFEVILNGTAMFNHGNIKLPQAVDRALRQIVVTPDMHRVHHSIVVQEANSNFGFNLPWWDRLFGTYRDQPAAGHEGMTIGLSEFREPKYLTFPYLLIIPFGGKAAEYAINGGVGAAEGE